MARFFEVLGALLMFPFIMLTYFSDFLPTLSMIASFVSMYLFDSVQNKITPLFWLALCVAIAMAGSIYLKSWMKKKRGVEQHDLGEVPIGWRGGWATTHILITLAGIGIFIYALVMKLSATSTK